MDSINDDYPFQAACHGQVFMPEPLKAITAKVIFRLSLIVDICLALCMWHGDWLFRHPLVPKNQDF